MVINEKIKELGLKNKINNVLKPEILIIILLLSFCFQNLNLFVIGEQAIKVYRVIVILYMLLIIIKKQLVIPSKKLTGMLIYMTVVSIANFFSIGIERLFFEYLFAFGILLVVYNIGKNIKLDDWFKIIQIVALIVLVAVTINVLVNFKEIINFHNNPYNEHPKYNSIFTGGVNLECTWIAMFAFFFSNKRKFAYAYIGLCMTISVLLSSRVGMIISIISFLYIFTKSIVEMRKQKDNKSLRLLIIGIIIAVIIATIIGITTNVFDNIINRIMSVGKDGGSQGRIRMWKYVMEAFEKRPFGYGAGNAIKGIKNVSGLWYDEDNVHNLLFQMILDFGFIGGIAYIYIIIDFIKNNIKKMWDNPFIMFILMYIVVGCIQFKGAELITFFMIGAFLTISNKERKDNELDLLAWKKRK